MEALKTDNPNVKAQYEAIIQNILREIDAKNVSITDFCEDMNIVAENFLESLNNPKDDFTYYLSILEKLKDYWEETANEWRFKKRLD